jgi:hypothetical protein
VEWAQAFETAATGRLEFYVLPDYIGDIDSRLELFFIAVFDSACHALILS